ncbi:hypothetical protein NG42_00850 [Winslowiella iniecta]|uniref:Uncharacterized protein n=1 Tax=Winslowiella iniecta TaxID=1560201 RepID=A0A0L7TIK3_9GAMM|nr:hypothetical protein NG42_00850 [Winslowiella iniecta]KOC95197.1 hypothetical protein NG43_00320 [Winslowiella iniecta]
MTENSGMVRQVMHCLRCLAITKDEKKRKKNISARRMGAAQIYTHQMFRALKSVIHYSCG